MKPIIQFIRKLITAILAACVVACAWYALKGWNRYNEATEEHPFVEMVSEIQSRPDYVTKEDLPEIYINAVLSVEDRRFENHNGIDLIGIARALWTDLTTLSLKEGGSTITQQLMKNQYFDQGKTIDRKAAEIFAALEFEKEYDKDTIFALYVNTIYFGSGYYGISEAAMGYFGKTPAELSDAEAIMLAGLPQAPSVYDPTVNPDLALQRMEQVMKKMIRCGFLTEEDADRIRSEASASFFYP